MNPFNWITTLGQRRANVYTIEVGGIPVVVTRKRIRTLRLKVHSPDGRVTISSPNRASRRVVKEFAESQLEWIRRHQDRVRSEPRDAPARFDSGETHYVWNRPYELTVVERDEAPRILLGEDHLTLVIRPGSDTASRAAVVTDWHKSLLREALPPLVQEWERRLHVHLEGYYLRRMKTRWGTCNYRTKHIRLNTELATKASHLFEYVVAHEMVHLIVPNHGKRFVALMNEHYPTWRAARAELNESRPPGN